MENIYYIVNGVNGYFLDNSGNLTKDISSVARWSDKEKALEALELLKKDYDLEIQSGLIKVVDLRSRAFDLYRAPFKFMCGYIFDANNEMVSDKAGDLEELISRLRGWGRISYLPDPEKLQDTVGELLAELLTKHWNNYGDWKSVKEHGLPTAPGDYLSVIHYSDTGPTQEVIRVHIDGCFRSPLCTEVTHWRHCPEMPND